MGLDNAQDFQWEVNCYKFLEGKMSIYNKNCQQVSIVWSNIPFLEMHAMLQRLNYVIFQVLISSEGWTEAKCPKMENWQNKKGMDLSIVI
jgi:hypothetical protein